MSETDLLRHVILERRRLYDIKARASTETRYYVNDDHTGVVWSLRMCSVQDET